MGIISLSAREKVWKLMVENCIWQDSIIVSDVHPFCQSNGNMSINIKLNEELMAELVNIPFR